MSPPPPTWPAGHHLVLTRSGLLRAGDDPRATASPVLTVDGRHPLPPPLSADEVTALVAATERPDDPSWSARWRPAALERPRVGSPGEEPLVARLPLVLGPAVGGFAAAGPAGPVRLEVDDLAVLAAFAGPSRPDAVAGDDPRVAVRVAALLGADLLVPARRVDGASDAGTRARQRSRMRQLRARRSLAGLDALEADDGRTPVVGLVTSLSDFPLSLGMVLAHAARSERLADRYSFHLAFATPGELARVDRPAVWLFSHYLWTEARNTRLARALDAAAPGQIRVFGGPQVPGPASVGPWMPTVGADVAVHGEGEATLEEVLHALPGSGAAGTEALAAVAGVAGCSVAVDGSARSGPARDRLADLDLLPSPFLDGWFDGLGGDLFFSAVLETNRGCPYGCTFCDWGSATRSRIRTFALDRIEAEVDWIAAHCFEHLLLADANFGILERDREIARALVRARARHGAPVVLGTNYAKNPKRHVVDIVADLVAGGFTTIGQVALQTTDRATLAAVNRSNIAPEGYDDLLRAFDALGLPVQTDLMMGLPGATPEAFRRDLQHVVDSDVHAIVARTKVLRNSPMNAPEYRRQFAIATAGDDFVLTASSFDEDDLDRMLLDHSAFFAVDDLGVLRVLARFVRHRTGLDEMAVVTALDAAAADAPERLPTLRWVLTTLARWAVEPVDWSRLLDEAADVVVHDLGVAGDTALDAVLAAQAALLPAAGRAWPVEVDLVHDVAGWWADLKAVRRSGGDWSAVADLADYGPASLRVDDPDRICDLAMGDLALMGRSPAWDLDSPLSRASPNGLLVTAG